MESMEDFASLLESSFNKVYNGDVLDGTIIEIQKDALVMDIHSYMDAIMPITDLLYDGEVLEDLYHVGDTMKVMVKRVDTRNDRIYVSKTEADKVVIWDALEEMRQEGTPLEVQVKEVVKGGLRVQYKGVRGFLPQFQIELEPVEELEAYVGKTLICVVQRVDREKKDVVVSRKELLRKKKAQERDNAISELLPGTTTKGTVARIENYGAFVELAPGVDGMVHISEMAWHRVKHPSDVVKVGQVVKVSVLSVDKEKGRIALTMKDVDQDPWHALEFKVGDKRKVTIGKIISAGAFAEVQEGIEGFLPISMISEKRIRNVREVLKEEDVVEVQIHAIDPIQRRVTLTMKEMEEEEVYAYDNDEEGFTMADAFKNFKL